VKVLGVGVKGQARWRRWTRRAAATVGAGLVVLGIGMWSVPVALVVAGIIVVGSVVEVQP